MAQKSPFNVSYQDLIDQAVSSLKWMEKVYPGMILQNRITSWKATHKVECQKVLIRILKKYQREPQIDLFEQVEKPIKIKLTDGKKI